jgi:hypothetical protein
MDGRLSSASRAPDESKAQPASGSDRRYRFEAMAFYLRAFASSAWTPRYVAILAALPRPSLFARDRR